LLTGIKYTAAATTTVPAVIAAGPVVAGVAGGAAVGITVGWMGYKFQKRRLRKASQKWAKQLAALPQELEKHIALVQSAKDEIERTRAVLEGQGESNEKSTSLEQIKRYGEQLTNVMDELKREQDECHEYAATQAPGHATMQIDAHAHADAQVDSSGLGDQLGSSKAKGSVKSEAEEKSDVGTKEKLDGDEDILEGMKSFKTDRELKDFVIQEREKGAKKILRGVQEIKTLFIAVAEAVKQNQPVVDNIEKNCELACERAKEGLEEIKRAAKYQRQHDIRLQRVAVGTGMALAAATAASYVAEIGSAFM
jgi:hypothetical protein